MQSLSVGMVALANRLWTAWVGASPSAASRQLPLGGSILGGDSAAHLMCAAGGSRLGGDSAAHLMCAAGAEGLGAEGVVAGAEEGAEAAVAAGLVEVFDLGAVG